MGTYRTCTIGRQGRRVGRHEGKVWRKGRRVGRQGGRIGSEEEDQEAMRRLGGREGWEAEREDWEAVREGWRAEREGLKLGRRGGRQGRRKRKTRSTQSYI
jgi:hypothetical protein